MFVISLCFVSCKKDSFITNAGATLTITQDSIKFDTVFATTGSITRSFKLINNNNQKLLLSQVKLMGGSASAFRININGNQSSEENDITIAANDSIYIFVSVFVNQTTAQLPFILSDRILISYNGNNDFVELEAYGQNAHFLRNTVISTNTNWPNDLPYVILGSIRVDTATLLTIEAGCKIYSHADAPFLVDGTLQVTGTRLNEVVFAGDRTDNAYRDLPAGWPGISFRATSINNELRFAIIKNANQAIVAEDPSSNGQPKLVLHQTIIDNAFEAGLFAYNSSVAADNCLISNCGNNLIIQAGGAYNFTNCTVAAFSSSYILHTNPVLQVSNAAIENAVMVTNDLSASFVNCIFWGDAGVDDEVVTEKEGANSYNVSLQNCLYKAINDPANAALTSVIVNQDPLFDSIDVSNKYFDFRVTKDPLAPGINTGTTIAFPRDLDNNVRTVDLPDIGSYEKQ